MNRTVVPFDPATTKRKLKEAMQQIAESPTNIPLERELAIQPDGQVIIDAVTWILQHASGQPFVAGQLTACAIDRGKLTQIGSLLMTRTQWEEMKKRMDAAFQEAANEAHIASPKR